MNPIFASVALVLVAAQIALPRRLAFVPLLAAICHLPNVSILGMGGGNFPITRLIIGVGLIRAVAFRVPICSPGHPLNVFVAVWSCVAILTSLAHTSEEYSPLIYSLGLVYNAAGTYLYARAYIKDLDSFALFVKCLIIVLLPLALLMMLENVTGRNSYAGFGGGIQRARVLARGQDPGDGALRSSYFGRHCRGKFAPVRADALAARPSLGSHWGDIKRGHCAFLIFKRSVDDALRQLCGAGTVALADKDARHQMVCAARLGVPPYDNEGSGMVSHRTNGYRRGQHGLPQSRTDQLRPEPSE